MGLWLGVRFARLTTEVDRETGVRRSGHPHHRDGRDLDGLVKRFVPDAGGAESHAHAAALMPVAWEKK